MTRLRFILLASLSALAVSLGIRRKLTHEDFTVETREVFDPQTKTWSILVLITDVKSRMQTGRRTPPLSESDLPMAREAMGDVARILINRRIKGLS